MCLSILLLIYLGPASPDESQDAIGMMTQFAALMYIGLSFAAMVACGGALLMHKKLNIKSNMVMLIFFAVVGGTGTVVNISISKFLQADAVTQSPVLFGCSTGLYLVLASVCLGNGAMANSDLQDPSLFVPISTGMNLVLNALAGICIWGDWSRLEHPTGYIVVYCLIVLATYLLAENDQIGHLAQTEIKSKKVRAIKHIATGGKNHFVHGKLSGKEALLPQDNSDAHLKAWACQKDDHSLEITQHYRFGSGVTLRKQKVMNCLKQKLQAGQLTKAQLIEMAADALPSDVFEKGQGASLGAAQHKDYN
jgi:hypothetical protein